MATDKTKSFSAFAKAAAANFTLPPMLIPSMPSSSGESKDSGPKRTIQDLTDEMMLIFGKHLEFLENEGAKSDFFVNLASYAGFDFAAVLQKIIDDFKDGTKNNSVRIIMQFILKAPGNATQKKTAKLVSGDSVQAAVKLLGIKTKADAVKKDDYTISRIGAVMHPVLVAAKWSQRICEVYSLGPSADVTLRLCPTTALFCSQDAAYCIPNEARWEPLWEIWLEWAKLHHEKVNPAKSGAAKTPFNESIQTVKRQSSQVDPQLKLRICQSWEDFMFQSGKIKRS